MPVRPQRHPFRFINHRAEHATVGHGRGLGGYPVVDVRVTLGGGSFDTNTSTALGYEVAAAQAFTEGCRKAQPVLLEPIMAVEVVVPEEFLGGVINGLSARKARIEGITPKPRAKVVDALVALSKMFGYSTELRSLSQGRATFSMHFARFDRATELPWAFAHQYQFITRASRHPLTPGPQPPVFPRAPCGASHELTHPDDVPAPSRTELG